VNLKINFGKCIENVLRSFATIIRTQIYYTTGLYVFYVFTEDVFSCENCAA